MLNDFRTAIYTMCKTANIDVYDYWVTDAIFPYIITSYVDLSDISYKDINKTDYTFEIHVFDKSIGKKTIIGIMETIRAGFNNIDATGKTYKSRILDNKEPNIVHGIVTINFKEYI